MRFLAFIFAFLLAFGIFPRRSRCQSNYIGPDGALSVMAGSDPPKEPFPSDSFDGSNSGEAILPARRTKKRHLGWEEAERVLGGLYARNLELCKAKYPQLTPMQHRVCALAKAMLPSWRIAEILGISVKTVENHFRSSRMRMGLPRGTRMQHHFAVGNTESSAVRKEVGNS